MVRLLPAHIKPDAIVEALIEVRFSQTEFPEPIIGRFLAAKELTGFDATRLPAADIPQSLREGEERLRFQPTYQLTRECEIVRFGMNVISYHGLAPYSGWAVFKPRALEIIAVALTAIGEASIERIGLRYVNAFSPEKHGISGVDDLSLNVLIGSKPLSNVAVSFLAPAMDDAETMVRVASKEHVKGDLPEDTALIVDVDVRTTQTPLAQTIEELADWLERAHLEEKTHFFDLIPDAVLKRLEVH